MFFPAWVSDIAVLAGAELLTLPVGFAFAIENFFTVQRNLLTLICKSADYIRLAVTLFSRIFTGEGTIGYMDCDIQNEEVKGQSSDPDWHLAMSLGKEEGRASCFVL